MKNMADKNESPVKNYLEVIGAKINHLLEESKSVTDVTVLLTQHGIDKINKLLNHHLDVLAINA